MCGRFGLTRPDKLDLRRFGVTSAPEVAPRFNVAPGTDILVVRERKAAREASLVRWGLVPWWADNPAIGARMANARADSAFSKPAFRDPMRQRRCLIPADVFYEWQVVAGQKAKQPYAVAMRDSEIFALGGIWDYWKPKDGGEGMVTCAILTTDPNTLLTPIHDRMPVIVPADRYAAWLDPRTPEPAVKDLVQPFPSDAMAAWPISPRVNRATEDDVGILQPSDGEPGARQDELPLG
jgi:putative SOS response-associated peptidase YedK